MDVSEVKHTQPPSETCSKASLVVHIHITFGPYSSHRPLAWSSLVTPSSSVYIVPFALIHFFLL